MKLNKTGELLKKLRERKGMTQNELAKDLFVDGRKMVVEIKPSSQTVPPKSENNWYTQEYRKNMCKWKATKEFCENKGYIFRIFTEKTIYNL